MARTMQAMDGNTAAAHIAYMFSELAAVYPITPSTPMAETVDEWGAQNRENIFGKTVTVQEMEHEGGAAGAVHGALKAGALTSTFTSSQGLLLMIPNMLKIAGELLPTVFHVAARAICTNSLNIYGDHSDVMAARYSGFAMLCENSVQEVMDLAGVAHLASIESSIPFLNFFDGFRTSHEIQKVEVIEQEELAPLLDRDALRRFRDRAMNPENPASGGTCSGPEFNFQLREAVNSQYTDIPATVKKYMAAINKLRGTNYDLVEYAGAKDAETVIVTMGSSFETIKQTVAALNEKGSKVGVISIRLYRPFPVEDFLAALPKTVKNIAVLDRTKETGSQAEPLLLDVQSVIIDSEFAGKVNLIGGRYGLGGKEFTPNHVVAVFDEAAKGAKAKKRFTVGITDDVTNTSLDLGPVLDYTNPSTFQGKFWGFGSDGTVGANKSAIKLIGNYTDKYVQGYFTYDSKKSGGLTVSHLRFGDNAIDSPYLITQADFISCSTQAYVKQYPVAQSLKPGGVFLLNTTWSDEDLETQLPDSLKKFIADNKVKFYTINAAAIAREAGLGGRTNTALQTAFFKLNPELLGDSYAQKLKDDAHKSYAKKSMVIVEKNQAAIDAVATNDDLIHLVDVPAAWGDLKAGDDLRKFYTGEINDEASHYFADVLTPLLRDEGNNVPISAIVKSGMVDGVIPHGGAALEKRGVAGFVPCWNAESCIGCNECAFACPHAAIRPILLNEAEKEAAPEGYIVKELKGADGLYYRIQISIEDCTGCGVCLNACPVNNNKFPDPKDEARPLRATTYASQVKAGEIAKWDYSTTVSEKVLPENFDKFKTARNSQFVTPLLEFSGACAGCGETPYVKLLTQLFGDRMYLANATGCSSIWGASLPSSPWAKDKNGYGVTWANSLFEDNAEFGLGMFLAAKTKRNEARELVESLQGSAKGALKEAIDAWLEKFDETPGNRERVEALVAALEGAAGSDKVAAELLTRKANLSKPSQWIIGGDGWGYDIGYGGVDHVLASGENVNVLIMDNEVYSNTGGQASKATPLAAIAKLAANGKATNKKDIGAMAMTYGNIYVAQIASGASSAQTLKAFKEAEAYDGPSLIIAYTPCINHGLSEGMHKTIQEAEEAVASGYWVLYRYNPETGELTIDSKEPDFSKMKEFMLKQNRFAGLQRIQADKADELYDKTVADAKRRYALKVAQSGNPVK